MKPQDEELTRMIEMYYKDGDRHSSHALCFACGQQYRHHQTPGEKCMFGPGRFQLTRESSWENTTH